MLLTQYYTVLYTTPEDDRQHPDGQQQPRLFDPSPRGMVFSADDARNVNDDAAASNARR